MVVVDAFKDVVDVVVHDSESFNLFYSNRGEEFAVIIKVYVV